MKKTVALTLRLSDETWLKIAKLALEQRISRTEVITKAIEKYLKE